MNYYRYTNKNNPTSDYGHAMFSDNLDKIQGYGKNLYIYNGENSVKIEDLKELIIDTWKQCQEDGFNLCDPYYENLEAEIIYSILNPNDIVNSAEGWDSEFIVSWFWEFIAEPNDIDAILTQDGAIVFNEDLIKLL